MGTRVSAFGPKYAEVYDSLYADKDYQAESQSITSLLEDNGVLPPSCILDLGCGTGRHMERLSRLGYTVVGVDSSVEMLDRARARLGQRAELMTPGDLSTSDKEFDAAYSLFHVLSYQRNLRSVDDFFALLTSRVRSGGLVAVDCWHLPGVVTSPPEVRRKDIELPGGRRVTRTVYPTVDWADSIISLRIELTEGELADPKTVGRRESETHVMRAFTPMELSLLAARHQLSQIEFCRDILDPGSVNETDWHILMIARKG